MTGDISTTREVVMVGAGVISYTSALALSAHGAAVHIIGPDDGGRGCASLAAGAMLGAFGEVTVDEVAGPDLHVQALRIRAQACYDEWLETQCELAGCDAQVKKGTFVVASAGASTDIHNLHAIETAARRNGARVERVDAADVPWLRPSVRAPVAGALHLADEGYIDAPAVMEVLRRAVARDPRITASDGWVIALERVGSGWTVHLRDGSSVACEHVVVCAGGGTGALLSAMDFPLPTFVAGKGASVTLRADEAPGDAPTHVIRTPNRDFACGVHVVPRTADRWYLGATNRFSATPGTGSGVTGGELHSLMHAGIHEINVGIRTAMVDRTMYGWRPLTSDHYPLVGLVDGGLAVATGTYRNGMLMAPVIGQWIATSILSGEDPEENMFAPMSRDRLLRDSSAGVGSTLEAGVQHLMAFLTGPHGELPYDRDRELTACLTSLLRLTLLEGDEEERTRERLREMITELPVPEIVADLYYELAGKEWEPATRAALTTGAL